VRHRDATTSSVSTNVVTQRPATRRVRKDVGITATEQLPSDPLPAVQQPCRAIDAPRLSHLLMARKDELLVPLMLGTANVSLKQRDIAGVEIPLPPLSQQQRIVARIEELVASIEEARGLRRQAVEEVSAFVSSLHMHLSQPEPIELSEILRLDEQKQTVQIGQAYPQVGVKGFGQGLFAKAAVQGSQTSYKAFNLLYEGALVLSQVKGWEGAVAVCSTALAGRYVSPEYRTFRCVPGKALPEYMAILVANPWFWGRLKNLTRGVGARRERTRPEQFLSMSIPMPDLEHQRQALSLLEELERIRPMQAEIVVELDALLPSILDKAFERNAKTK
jgi:type I restriction enzyme S subunit